MGITNYNLRIFLKYFMKIFMKILSLVSISSAFFIHFPGEDDPVELIWNEPPKTTRAPYTGPTYPKILGEVG